MLDNSVNIDVEKVINYWKLTSPEDFNTMMISRESFLNNAPVNMQIYGLDE